MAFYVGQKVECIKDAVAVVGTDLGLPRFKKGQRFTVAAIETVLPWGDFLSFVECDPRKTGHVSGFRPVAERKTDISIFKALLNPANHKQLEGV